MQQGTAKFFDLECGYGFIVPDDGGVDLFVHARALYLAGLYSLIEGDRVEFELGPSPKKRGQVEACDIKKIGRRCVPCGDRAVGSCRSSLRVDAPAYKTGKRPEDLVQWVPCRLRRRDER